MTSDLRRSTRQGKGRDHDQRTVEAQGYRRWYWTARWRATAKAQLAREPLCRMCSERGEITPATVCDHITPHRGDAALFWSGPFQSLCRPCHDGAKQSEERTGRVRGCDEHGRPLDARKVNEPWPEV